MRILDTKQKDFKTQLSKLLDRSEITEPSVIQTVEKITHHVQKEGDKALLEYTKQLDQWTPENADALIVEPQTLKNAWNATSSGVKAAMQEAHRRIMQFHEVQSGFQSFQYTDKQGNKLGQKIFPIDPVGLYVPGGQASYPSSVLMNAIPAQIAGVHNITITTPAPQGKINQSVLAAAHMCNIKTVFKIGGAQAIAALTYGTKTIPKVDKIVGPGNRYVAIAKKNLFGQVGIDMIAGPSEILIVADESTPEKWLVLDLFSQAEHDENAQSILITQSPKLIQNVQKMIETLLPKMPRKKIIAQSLKNKGALILTHHQEETQQLINQIAPEHLEIATQKPDDILKGVRNAGAVFIGKYTCEAMGDYCAGTNHVLPTSGSARFSSGLSVYDFQKRISTVQCTAQSAQLLGKTAYTLAKDESLDAHAQSAKMRTK